MCSSKYTEYFFSWRSQSEAIYLFWKTQLINYFLPFSGILRDQNARKCYSSWHASLFKLRILQLYLLHFLTRFQSIAFNWSQSFVSNMKIIFTSWMLIDQKWRKCYYWRDILIFRLIFLEKYAFGFFFQVWIDDAKFLMTFG